MPVRRKAGMSRDQHLRAIISKLNAKVSRMKPGNARTKAKRKLDAAIDAAIARVSR